SGDQPQAIEELAEQHHVLLPPPEPPGKLLDRLGLVARGRVRADDLEGALRALDLADGTVLGSGEYRVFRRECHTASVVTASFAARGQLLDLAHHQIPVAVARGAS